MKTTKLLTLGTLFLGTMLLTACGEGDKQAKDQSQTDSTEMAAEPVTYDVDVTQSKVHWKGTMVGANLIELYSHFGVLDFNHGSIVLSGDRIKSGSFIVDMTSINPTDSGYTEDNPRSKLIGHLNSPDFFNTAEYPTATYTINKVEGNTATGTLSIRGHSHTETVTNIEVKEMGDHYMITGDLTFDRQKYDVAWSTGAADKAVSDDIKLNISLVTQSKRSS